MFETPRLNKKQRLKRRSQDDTVLLTLRKKHLTKYVEEQPLSLDEKMGRWTKAFEHPTPNTMKCCMSGPLEPLTESPCVRGGQQDQKARGENELELRWKKLQELLGDNNKKKR